MPRIHACVCDRCEKSYRTTYRGAHPLCKRCTPDKAAGASPPEKAAGTGPGQSGEQGASPAFESVLYMPKEAEIAFTAGHCLLHSITAMDPFADTSFEELRHAAYQQSPPPRTVDGFVGEGFCDALELRRMRKHQVALTLAPDGAGGCAAILHVRSTGPRQVAAPVALSELWELASLPAQLPGAPLELAQRESFEPMIVWEEGAWFATRGWMDIGDHVYESMGDVPSSDRTGWEGPPRGAQHGAPSRGSQHGAPSRGAQGHPSLGQQCAASGPLDCDDAPELVRKRRGARLQSITASEVHAHASFEEMRFAAWQRPSGGPPSLAYGGGITASLASVACLASAPASLLASTFGAQHGVWPRAPSAQAPTDASPRALTAMGAVLGSTVGDAFADAAGAPPGPVPVVGCLPFGAPTFSTLQLAASRVAAAIHESRQRRRLRAGAASGVHGGVHGNVDVGGGGSRSGSVGNVGQPMGRSRLRADRTLVLVCGGSAESGTEPVEICVASSAAVRALCATIHLMLSSGFGDDDDEEDDEDEEDEDEDEECAHPPVEGAREVHAAAAAEGRSCEPITVEPCAGRPMRVPSTAPMESAPPTDTPPPDTAPLDTAPYVRVTMPSLLTALSLQAIVDYCMLRQRVSAVSSTIEPLAHDLPNDLIAHDPIAHDPIGWMCRRAHLGEGFSPAERRALGWTRRACSSAGSRACSSAGSSAGLGGDSMGDAAVSVGVGDGEFLAPSEPSTPFDTPFLRPRPSDPARFAPPFAPPFAPTVSPLVVDASGRPCRLQAITAMAAYESASFEEIRYSAWLRDKSDQGRLATAAPMQRRALLPPFSSLPHSSLIDNDDGGGGGGGDGGDDWSSPPPVLASPPPAHVLAAARDNLTVAATTQSDQTLRASGVEVIPLPRATTQSDQTLAPPALAPPPLPLPADSLTPSLPAETEGPEPSTTPTWFETSFHGAAAAGATAPGTAPGTPTWLPAAGGTGAASSASSGAASGAASGAGLGLQRLRPPPLLASLDVDSTARPLLTMRMLRSLLSSSSLQAQPRAWRLMALDLHTATALSQLPTRGVCELATAASFLDCAPMLEIAISNLAERLETCNLPHEIRALFDMPESDSPQAPYCAPQATAPQAAFACAAADSKGTGAVVAMAITAAAGGGQVRIIHRNDGRDEVVGGSPYLGNRRNHERSRLTAEESSRFAPLPSPLAAASRPPAAPPAPSALALKRSQGKKGQGRKRTAGLEATAHAPSSGGRADDEVGGGMNAEEEEELHWLETLGVNEEARCERGGVNEEAGAMEAATTLPTDRPPFALVTLTTTLTATSSSIAAVTAAATATATAVTAVTAATATAATATAATAAATDAATAIPTASPVASLATPYLDADLVEQALLRLPMRSLLIARRVSEAWRAGVALLMRNPAWQVRHVGVRELLEGGASDATIARRAQLARHELEVIDQDGNTPLHLAVRCAGREALGASPQRSRTSRRDASEDRRQRELDEIDEIDETATAARSSLRAAARLARGATGGSARHVHCPERISAELLSAMAAAGAETAALSAEYRRGEVPLHEALRLGLGRPKVLALLHAAPRAASCLDYRGRSPLHLAACYGAPCAVVQALLNYRPHAAVTCDDEGHSPLDLALRRKHANPYVIAMLERHRDAVFVALEADDLQWTFGGQTETETEEDDEQEFFTP